MSDDCVELHPWYRADIPPIQGADVKGTSSMKTELSPTLLTRLVRFTRLPLSQKRSSTPESMSISVQTTRTRS